MKTFILIALLLGTYTPIVHAGPACDYVAELKAQRDANPETKDKFDKYIASFDMDCIEEQEREKAGLPPDGENAQPEKSNPDAGNGAGAQ